MAGTDMACFFSSGTATLPPPEGVSLDDEALPEDEDIALGDCPVDITVESRRRAITSPAFFMTAPISMTTFRGERY